MGKRERVRDRYIEKERNEYINMKVKKRKIELIGSRENSNGNDR